MSKLTYIRLDADNVMDAVAGKTVLHYSPTKGGVYVNVEKIVPGYAKSIMISRDYRTGTPNYVTVPTVKVTVRPVAGGRATTLNMIATDSLKIINA